MEQYESMINHVIKQFGNLDHETKEDIKQDLRMYLFEKHIELANKALDIDKYLFIILKRKVLDLLKNSKYKKFQSLNELTKEGDEYIDLVAASNIGLDDNSATESLIMDYVNQHLSKQDKDILSAYFYQNMTYKQIGKKYGVSADTIRRKIQKILDEIRKWWR